MIIHSKVQLNLALKKSDIVTSVSKSLAQETHEIIETNKEIIPIYNFVRENEFPTKHNTALKSQFGIAPDEKSVNTCIEF